jgi:hypothetical protein
MNTSVGDEDVLYEDFLNVRTKLNVKCIDGIEICTESYRMLYRHYRQVSNVVQTVPPSIVFCTVHVSYVVQTVLSSIACCRDSTAKHRLLYRQYRQVSYLCRQYRQVSYVVQTVPPSIVCCTDSTAKFCML